jgi:hypothetical protein
MKKVFAFVIVVFMCLSQFGCYTNEQTKVSNITYRLDSNDDYTGFRYLPKNYTAEQAQKDGYLVKVNFKTVSGLEAWNSFLKDSSQGKNAAIRIVNIWNETVYYSDLFFKDGNYRVFNSDSNDLQDYKFTHLLQLTGTLPNAAKSGKVVIITDDENLTYKDVMWSYFSSDSEYSKNISSFKLVIMD